LKQKQKQEELARKDDDPSKRPPQTFVFKMGRVGLTLKELRDNLRKVMQPHTAINLKVRVTEERITNSFSLLMKTGKTL
jgi:hypothetical protein